MSFIALHLFGGVGSDRGPRGDPHWELTVYRVPPPQPLDPGLHTNVQMVRHAGFEANAGPRYCVPLGWCRASGKAETSNTQTDCGESADPLTRKQPKPPAHTCVGQPTINIYIAIDPRALTPFNVRASAHARGERAENSNGQFRPGQWSPAGSDFKLVFCLRSLSGDERGDHGHDGDRDEPIPHPHLRHTASRLASADERTPPRTSSIPDGGHCV
jgi:hypothetical protein